jgi:cytochrome o ubiquinol oxidase subunit 1
MIVGVALFGIFAGLSFWFPKIFGFKLNEELDKLAFWFWFIGFFVAFIPLYLLGFMGAPRRIDHYDSLTGWQPLYITSMIGFVIICIGVLVQVYMVIVSIRDRKKNRDVTGDPWDGRTLEWAAHSPPPHYNFAVLPPIKSHEPFWDLKKEGWKPDTNYHDIEGFKNTGMGVYIAFISFFFGFAIVWHIYWLIAVTLAGIIACVIILSFDDEMEHILPAAEVAEIEESYRKGERLVS